MVEYPRLCSEQYWHELPAYSSVDPQKLQNGVTLENMDMDEDEGVGGVEDLDPHQSGYNYHNGA